MSVPSSEESSSKEPPSENITDRFSSKEEQNEPRRSRLAIGAAATATVALFAAGIYSWANSGEKEAALPPTPAPISTLETPFPQLHPPTALFDAQGALKLDQETSAPRYELCGDVSSIVLRQAHVEGDPQAKDDESFEGKQAVLTTSAEEVSKAFAAGYDNLTVGFVPQNEAGTFSAEDAECAIDGPEVLPVKGGKIWAASGIGKEATLFSFVATNDEGFRRVLPTRLYKVQKPGSTIKAGSAYKNFEVPLY